MQLDLLAQLHASGLLGGGNVAVVPLNVGDMAQRQRHGIADAVAHAHGVQAGRELAGVGGGDKEQRNGQGHEVFQGNVEVVEQLLPGQVIGPEQVAEHHPSAVELRALIGGEKENKEVVQGQKNHHEPENEADVFEFDMTDREAAEADDHQPQQHPRIVGQHTGEGEQQEKHQLGGARQGVDHALAGDVAHDRITALGHLPAPPCQNQ